MARRDGLHLGDSEVDEPVIDADGVFANRLTLARARTSELLAVVRELSNAPPPANNDREQKLRIFEGELANALHWAQSLKRSVG